MPSEGAGQRGRVEWQKSGVKQSMVAADHIKGMALSRSRTLSKGYR